LKRARFLDEIVDRGLTMNKTDKIFVAGHKGMVGSACMRLLRKRGFTHLVTVDRSEVDLTCEQATLEFLSDEQPDIVINAAARVGGIHANKTYPAEFLRDNLAIGLHLVQGSYKAGVSRLLNLGSTCIYPREAPQPMPEDCLLTSPLETTNEGYAIAKIATLKLCQYYRSQYEVLYHSAMPTNLYGPGDMYHAENSHVLPALLRRFHEAKVNGLPSVTVWGTGTVKREFLHVDDLSEAMVHLLELENPPDWVNVGTGVDCTICDLAESIAKTVGFEGELLFDTSRPDGTPRKLTSIEKIRATGWQPKISLQEGLEDTYKDFLGRLHEGTLRL